MIRTLQGYLSRELAKVTVLALVAFTLIMTVLAIIEPLRRKGLAGEQVLALFTYTLPMMLSLTFPIAALFAATMVYGRFSQDNELMACRASGISTSSLLRPAIVLGLVCTLISLALGHFVTPRMARGIEYAVKANVRSLVYQQLRTEGHLKLEQFRGYLIHASGLDEKNNMLYGVVTAKIGDDKQVQLLAAPTAKVDLHTYGDDTYAAIYLQKPTAMYQNELVQVESQPLESGKLRNRIEERPAWYDWHKLIDTLDQPARSAVVQKALEKISRRIAQDMLARDLVGAISSGSQYDKLRSGENVYSIKAASAQVVEDPEMGRASLAGDASGPLPERVQVTVLRGGRPVQVVQADAGKIKAAWSAMSGCSLVTIELEGDVSVQTPGQEQLQRRRFWQAGQIEVPDDVRREAEGISLEQLYTNPAQVTANATLINQIRALNNRTIPEVVREIKAEMHSRIAYSLSCLLLVSLGAALGLIFRGGQVVSAFAIAVVPASVVIVMILMGKTSLKNVDVAPQLGLAAIWGGIVALAVANVAVHMRLLRR